MPLFIWGVSIMSVKLLEGHPAEDLARLCFSKLRFLPVPLKDRLRQEGLWEDLAQELYRVALEGWRQGKTPRDIGGMATREVRAFLAAYGYRRYRDGFVKRETLLSVCTKDGDLDAKPVCAPTWDGLEKAILALLRKHSEELSQCQVNKALRRLAPAALVTDHCARLVVRGVVKETARPKGKGRRPSPMLALMGREDHLQEKILALLRKSPGGLSKRIVRNRFWLYAQELDRYCAPLIEQGLVVEIKRENTFGRHPTPLLVAVQPGVPLPAPHMVRTQKMDRIRQVHFAEGKSMKQIAKQLHHDKRTVREAIYGVPSPRRRKGRAPPSSPTSETVRKAVREHETETVGV